MERILVDDVPEDVRLIVSLTSISQTLAWGLRKEQGQSRTFSAVSTSTIPHRV